jgi:hypothetical protein
MKKRVFEAWVFFTFLNHIKEPTHDHGTEEVLKGHKGVRDTQQQSRKL